MDILVNEIADFGMEDDAELRGQQYLIERLRREWEYGHIGLLDDSVKKDKRLRNSKFPHIRDEFLVIEAETMRGIEIEKEYGRGALLNIDHPFVQKLASVGPCGGEPIIPATLVQAARAYRDIYGPF